MLEVPDVDFIRRPCRVVVFALFCCRLDLFVVSIMLVVCTVCGECYVSCLQFECFLSMCLFGLCVLCLTVLVNCLLNAFAICVEEVNVLSLKVIVLFLGCAVFFVANPYIVFLSVCIVFVIPVFV